MGRKRRKKILTIIPGTPIEECVAKFCEKAGVDIYDIGHAHGQLGLSETMEKQVHFLIKTAFLSGIYYAYEIEDDDLYYEYLTEKQYKELFDMFESLTEKEPEPEKSPQNHANYIG